MYSLKDVDDTENKSGNGVKIVENLKHKKYDVSFNKKIIRYKIKRIQSEQHIVRTCEVCNISFDGKRYIVDNDINTFAYFHKDIN